MQRILFVTSALPTSPSAGCNQTLLLRALQRRGFQAESLDLAQQLTAAAREESRQRGESAAERKPAILKEREGVWERLRARLREALTSFQPDTLLVFGEDRLIAEIAALAKPRECRVIPVLSDFSRRNQASFENVDGILCYSKGSASYHQEFLGRPCIAVPPLLDPAEFRAELVGPGFVTLIDPTRAHGALVFARIVDELGRRRPDIPVLIVEGTANAESVAESGMDLRVHGNLNVMDAAQDPQTYWSVTRIALMPWLTWEDPPIPAIQALVNGVPTVASKRGLLPETLGNAGIFLPLPDRLTAATRSVATAEEVAPWVEANIRLWDDPALQQAYRARALIEAGRFQPTVVESQWILALEDLASKPRPVSIIPPGRAASLVLVPFLDHIEWDCERGLRILESAGVRVLRARGSSQIDVSRNTLASQALHLGAESVLFIDSDIVFDPQDALRLLARPEPVIAGVYPKKGRLELSSQFADDVDEIVFGHDAEDLYPLKYAATGFLRIRTDVLRRMIDQLALPLCDTRWGQGNWPFFQPIVVPFEDGAGHHYLGEDWAFSHRLAQLGVTPLADTSIRLWHFGRFGYGWEDAAIPPQRYYSFPYRLRASTSEPNNDQGGGEG